MYSLQSSHPLYWDLAPHGSMFKLQGRFEKMRTSTDERGRKSHRRGNFSGTGFCSFSANLGNGRRCNPYWTVLRFSPAGKAFNDGGRKRLSKKGYTCCD